MDSEHRHELQTNALAKFLAEQIEAWRPYMSQLLLAAIAIVAAVAIYNFSQKSRSTKAVAGWGEYATATLPTNSGDYDWQVLKTAAEQYSDKPVGERALLAWTDGQVQQASRIFFTNKAETKQRLDEAEEAYKKLSASKQEDIRQRAEFGLAQVAEMRGNYTEAIEAYKKVTGLYAKLAESRAEFLGEMSPNYDLSWLASAQGSITPPAMGSGFRPDFSADDLALPGMPAGDAAGADSENYLELLEKLQQAAPEAPVTDTPPAGEVQATDPLPPPTETAPEGEGAGAPAGDAPAAETPTAEKPATP